MRCPHCASNNLTKSKLGNKFCGRCKRMMPIEQVFFPKEKVVPMEKSKLHKWAMFYLEKLKWSIIPINPDGKKPLVKWKEYQKRLPTAAEIDKWWTDTPDANIGLVTGHVSGLSVIDIDEYKTPGTIEYMQELYLNVFSGDHEVGNRPWDNCYSSRTARGGYHWFFEFHPELISRQAIPAVDIKSAGGYVVLPPSDIKGSQYKWIKKPWRKDKYGEYFKYPPPTCPPMYVDIFCENPTRDSGEGVISPVKCNANIDDHAESDDIRPIQGQGLEVTPSAFANRIIGFKKGMRDESLFHVANCLFRGGMSPHNINNVIDAIGRMVCDPPYRDAGLKFASAAARQAERERPLKEEIEDWIVQQEGMFTNNELDRELNISSKKDRRNRRKIIQRLRRSGLIEMANGSASAYRKIDTELEPIDYVNVKKDHRYDDFRWPLGVEEFYMLMPKNIVIVSGAPDAGKTGFLLEVADKNMDRFPINYFSSEMGNIEFQHRLEACPWRTLNEWKIKAFERDANFHDVIRPNEVNIVDFLELYDNFYEVGKFIKNIYNKLDKGVAIIGLQKNPGNENPLGGQRAREKARMVLNIDRVKLKQCGEYQMRNLVKITKCKNRTNPLFNPVGLYHYFEMEYGCKCEPIGEWRKEE